MGVLLLGSETLTASVLGRTTSRTLSPSRGIYGKSSLTYGVYMDDVGNSDLSETLESDQECVAVLRLHQIEPPITTGFPKDLWHGPAADFLPRNLTSERLRVACGLWRWL